MNNSDESSVPLLYKFNSILAYLGDESTLPEYLIMNSGFNHLNGETYSFTKLQFYKLVNKIKGAIENKLYEINKNDISNILEIPDDKMGELLNIINDLLKNYKKSEKDAQDQLNEHISFIIDSMHSELSKSERSELNSSSGGAKKSYKKRRSTRCMNRKKMRKSRSRK